MAKTFDQYEKNKRDSLREWPGGKVDRPTFEARLNAVMDQEELLKGVCARVKAFVQAYEESMRLELTHVAETRENPEASERVRRIADNMERDLQTLTSTSTPGDPELARLLLDDLKVLLDQMPEGYKG